MPVEVLMMEGKGNFQITGQIGDVMQESAQAALSYLKSRVRDFDLIRNCSKGWIFIFISPKEPSPKMVRAQGLPWQQR